MARFAADPRWLVYLPPTMSPSEPSQREGYLEFPAEAFAHYRAAGVSRVVCEEKHMGSRAVVIACRDADAARERFGVTTGETGICYTRPGRRFFSDATLEAAFQDRVRAGLTAAGSWEQLNTNWVVLDCELMPWSAKAQELLRGQCAAVGAAARGALPEATAALRRASGGADAPPEVAALLERFEQRGALAGEFVAAYRHYCWPVQSLDDLRLAPFHILATEGAVHTDKDHTWHMETLAGLCAAAGDPLLHATPYRVVDLASEASEAGATEWWEQLTGRGGEGMVVKPLDFITRGGKGRLVQPVDPRL